MNYQTKDKLKRYGLTGGLLLAPIIAVLVILQVNVGDTPAITDAIETKTEVAQEKVSVEINESIFFAYDSSVIDTDASNMLDDITAMLKTDPSAAWQINGHTDERGSSDYNLSLGESRANAVRNYLIKRGIEAHKLTIVSFGESNPTVQGQDEEAYAVNRRVEFSKVTALTQR